MNLICKGWILLSESIKPESEGRISKSVMLKYKSLYLSPNSISVSLRYSSGPNRFMSLRMMLRAPVPGG